MDKFALLWVAKGSIFHLALHVFAGSSGAALSATPAPGDGTWETLSWGDGVIIGLVVACLTIIYVVGMSVFIQFKRRKKREKNMWVTVACVFRQVLTFKEADMFIIILSTNVDFPYK